MLKNLFISFFIILGLMTIVHADHLPQENFAAMSPTVKIVSYKLRFSGYVRAIGSGSGTVVSAGGLVITNNHVIYDEVEDRPLDAFEICVTFDFQKEPVCNYSAQLIANDKDLDLAILKINGQDVFGKQLPPLKFMNYKAQLELKEQQEIQVVGYPASGGDTVTITKGQISGFDEFNNFSYIKTDTDFDHGSSGGTVLDAQGNYIGVPTYIRSYAENVGYFLDIREAATFLENNLNDPPMENAEAEKELKRDLERFVKANDSLEYVTTDYPHLSVELPNGWHFFEIDDAGFYAAEKNLQDGVALDVSYENYHFPISEGYMEKVDEQFVNIRDRFADFKKEDITFAGQSGWQITYTTYNQRNTILLIPYGYSLVRISYGIDLDKEEKQLETIKPVLDSLTFTKSSIQNPDLSRVIQYDRPPFEISIFEDWRIQKPMGSRSGDLLARAVQKDNYEGVLTLYYSFIPRDEQLLTPEEKLEESTKAIAAQNLKLVSKKGDVFLDGLEGYLYIFEYEGAQYQQIRKRLVTELSHGEYVFVIQYDDLTENFDENLPTITKVLNSFRYLGKDVTLDSETDFGALEKRFTDIQHHRFATAISKLADKGIVKGYEDGSFRPEWFVKRAEALKMILESKNLLEEERGLGKEVDFVDYQTGTVWYNKYLAYARQENFIDSVSRFRPGETIQLAEALKLIILTYDIPLWEGQTSVWYKRYMDKAYELNWLPRGWDAPEKKLTRAELSYLVNRVYNQAK